MQESTIQPDTDHAAEKIQPQESRLAQEGHAPETEQRTGRTIIWTPKFLLTFALTLVLGISIQSILTQAWASSLITGTWVILLPQIILVGLAWLGLGITTRARWMRIGCIFGGIWTLFMLLNIFTNLQGISPGTILQASINVAICMSLLGTTIGLSIEDAPLPRWDTWLFFLVPAISAIAVALAYFLTPQASIITVYDALATAAVVASCLFWWLRPSCWRRFSGPTFLIGLVPAILLIISQFDGSMHEDFFLLQVTHIHTGPGVTSTNNLFFAQICLLCIFLGCIRLWKSEKAH